MIIKLKMTTTTFPIKLTFDECLTLFQDLELTQNPNHAWELSYKTEFPPVLQSFIEDMQKICHGTCHVSLGLYNRLAETKETPASEDTTLRLIGHLNNNQEPEAYKLHRNICTETKPHKNCDKIFKSEICIPNGHCYIMPAEFITNTDIAVESNPHRKVMIDGTRQLIKRSKNYQRITLIIDFKKDKEDKEEEHDDEEKYEEKEEKEQELKVEAEAPKVKRAPRKKKASNFRAVRRTNKE